MFSLMKKALFPPAEPLQSARGIKLVHVAVKPSSLRAEVLFQNVASALRPHPLLMASSEAGSISRLEHHQLGQQAFCAEPCFCQYLFQAKPLPDLMAHMHGAAGLLT
jgi:hypothetical protein